MIENNMKFCVDLERGFEGYLCLLGWKGGLRLICGNFINVNFFGGGGGG